MKLPKPRKRGESWSISIMLNGVRHYCTRDSEQECLQWAMLRVVEESTKPADKIKTDSMTFHELFNIYYRTHGQDTKSKPYIRAQLNQFEKVFAGLSNKNIKDITAQDLTNWRNKRQKEVSANTVLKEISLYSSIFSFAQKELFLLEQNVWFNLKKPKKPKPRSRRISQREIEMVIAALDYEVGQIPTKSSHYVAWAFLFAIETAMRKGEILAIKKADIYQDHIHLEDTKNGESRDVPLTHKAQDLLKLINHNYNSLIPVTPNAFRLQFERTKAKIGLDELHFHDTRHEAITRLVNDQKLSVEVLAKVTGHKTIKVLVNTYYNPDIKDIVKLLNR